MPDLSQNLVHLRWLLKLVDFRAAGELIMGTVSLSIFTSSSGPPIYIPTHNEFQWTPYEDPTIRAVIPDEYSQNPNAWLVKVALVNYATVEMHQLDRVLRQFGFRQPILVAPEYDYIPTREPIVVPELVCVPEYMPWFKIHNKPYLLSTEER
ncbi:hypothetical protein Gotur_023869, partial [Gossypium turneri]